MHADRIAPSDAVRHPGRGFTLVELLAVIAIIGILAAIALGISGYASRKSDRSKAVAQMERLKMALEEHRIAKSRYPVSVNNAVSDAAMLVLSNYMKNISAVDPWGSSFYYSCSNNTPYSFRLFSMGPDRLPFTADDVEPGGS